MDLQTTLIQDNIFGFLPTHQIYFVFPLATIVLWLLFYPIAWKRNIRIFYNGSLKASWFEEIIFRGLIFGFVQYVTHDQLIALVVSSLLFGLVHMKNIWWAGWWRAARMSVYHALVTGIVFGGIRLITGDIYVGIFVHFIYNFTIILGKAGTDNAGKGIPKDDYLRHKSGLNR